jgi:hypothetical protein
VDVGLSAPPPGKAGRREKMKTHVLDLRKGRKGGKEVATASKRLPAQAIRAINFEPIAKKFPRGHIGGIATLPNGSEREVQHYDLVVLLKPSDLGFVITGGEAIPVKSQAEGLSLCKTADDKSAGGYGPRKDVFQYFSSPGFEMRLYHENDIGMYR